MSAEHDLPDDWTPEQHDLFTRMFGHVSMNQELFRHPKTPHIAAEEWETVAWNTAWVAAVMSSGCGPLVHVDEDGSEVGAESPAITQ